MVNKQDKILGCWLGKCIGGNIGAPYEGMKQRLPISFDRSILEKEIPNDDLDLQILWLEVVERKGKDINAEDLADAFYQNCPYAPGEYAFFKKNYQKGIMPPLSGNFNNNFFCNGMGSPIRSEIWACLFPENIDEAIRFAKMDSSLDHQMEGDSYWGEVFLTALECLCFTGSEPYELVEKALAYIPKDCALSKTIRDVMVWCKQTRDMEVIQTSIIRRHGHSESCMAKQNIGILIAAFLLHGTDFEGAIMEAVQCGFDADCTCATLGSIIGIIVGGAALQKEFGVKDMKYKLGVTSTRTDFTVATLSRDVYNLSEGLKKQRVEGRITVEQQGNPAISIGEEKEIALCILSPKKRGKVTLQIRGSEYLEVSPSKVEVSLQDCATVLLKARLKNGDTYPEGAGGEVWLENELIGKFGVSTRRKWKVFGPYWKNEVVIPPLNDGKTYGKYVPWDNLDHGMDHMRLFHLSCLPDEEKITDIKQLEKEVYEIAETEEDIVFLNDTTGFEGNSVYYFQTEFYAPEEMTTGIQVGKNVPIKVWLNGELLTEKEGNETFYYEVRHKLSVKLKKGKNALLFKVVKNSDNGKFSYQFLSNGVCFDHATFALLDVK